MRRYVKRAAAVLTAALVCSSLMGVGVLAKNESDVKDGETIETVESSGDIPDGKPGTDGEPETDVEPAGEGITLANEETAPLLVETAQFTLKTNINGNNQYTDSDREFTYNFNFTKDAQGITTSLPYQLKTANGAVEKEGTLEVKNGTATVSFPAKYTLEFVGMRTGITYSVTRKDDTNYTWDNTTFSGTTSTAGTNISYNATYKYSPVKYSLDTSIVVNMQGREFKSGDTFLFSIAPEKEGDPVFNRFPLPSGDSDEFAYYTNEARIKPTSGTSTTLQLSENLQNHSAVVCTCGKVFRTSAECIFLSDASGCFGSYSVQTRNINISPEIILLYTGTYSYIIRQSSVDTTDIDSIQQDQTQYRVTVKVTASGATLTPTLSGVQKSVDGGKSWQNVADKKQLKFNNSLKIGGVVKGDINKSGQVDIKDVMMCLNHVAKAPNGELQGEAFVSADVNEDNRVDIKDVMRMLNYVVGKTASL